MQPGLLLLPGLGGPPRRPRHRHGVLRADRGPARRAPRTIEGVSMIHYNEPTADKLFLDRVQGAQALRPAAGRADQRHRPDPAADRCHPRDGRAPLPLDQPLDPRPRALPADRGGDHLPLVLRHLDYLKDKPLAPQMDIAVLGNGDEVAPAGLRGDPRPLRGRRFQRPLLRSHEPCRRGADRSPATGTDTAPVRLRADRVAAGAVGAHQPEGAVRAVLPGLSRPVRRGRSARGEARRHPLRAPACPLLRRWVYGMEPAPDDFICRRCIYALAS